MTESRFYRFLQALNPKELKRFRKYMESPFFVTHEKLFMLFEIFERHLISNSKDPIEKENVWKELYPDRPFDYDFLRKLQHLLVDLGYDFLAQLAFDENLPQKSHSALQMLSRKQMTDFFEPAIRAGMNHLKKEPNRPGTYYYDLYSIEKYHYVLENLESARVQKVNIQKLNLYDIDGHINTFYFAEKLKYYCLLLSWSKMTNVNLDVPFIEEVVKAIHTRNYIEIPAIAIYYQIYLTFIEPENEFHFIKLKDLIKAHIHLFPSNDARDIMNSAINYTIQKQNQGELKYSKDNFELWKEALDKEIVLTNGELSPWAFKNIITLALRLSEFKWVEDFIELYGNKINIEYRENAINYNKASLYFYKRDYNKVIPLLQQIQYDEVNYGLGSKSLLLATFYELDEFESLSSLYESFKHFIDRNKSISDHIKKSYLQLIKITKKLTQNRLDKAKLISIKAEIISTQVASKNWLLEKVDELLQ